jgi:hypothetical protein
MNSGFLKLNWKDFLKGLLMALYGAIAGCIISAGDAWYQALQNGIPFHFEWNTVWIVALGATIAYLKKQLFTNSDGVPLSKDK